MIFKIGDQVRITYRGNTLEGEIFLACSSGLSVTLTFNGRLESYAGLMPVLWTDDGYVDLVHGQSVGITRRGQLIPWPETSKQEVLTTH
ncbi:MAG TPA: hypothetical protein VI685_02165 [Candidatus Angelobacter sp.]